MCIACSLKEDSHCRHAIVLGLEFVGDVPPKGGVLPSMQTVLRQLLRVHARADGERARGAAQAAAALQACAGNLERAADWLFSHADDLAGAVAAVGRPAGAPTPPGAAAAAGGAADAAADVPDAGDAVRRGVPMPQGPCCATPHVQVC